MCCEKTDDAYEVGDEVPQRSNTAFHQKNENLIKPDARMMCPICFHPYKLLGFMYKHMRKAHPESFKLIAEMLGADEKTLDGQGHDDHAPMLYSEKPLSFCEDSNVEQKTGDPSCASDKENVVLESASFSREEDTDDVHSSGDTYPKKFSAKRKDSTTSALKSHKEKLAPSNPGKENVSLEVPQSSRNHGSSKEASADGCQPPRLKRAKTDSATRLGSTGQKNAEGEVLHENPPKKLLEQFRFLYLKGLHNMWLECANQQNHSGSNVSKNENGDLRSPGLCGLEEFFLEI